MSLLKINDVKSDFAKDGQNEENQESQIIIGIDLGTSNSVVSYYNEDSSLVEVIPIYGHKLVPSIVSYGKDNVLVGNKALDNADNFSNYKTIISVKRLIGKSIDQINQDYLGFNIKPLAHNNNAIVIDLGDKVITPQQVSAEILKHLKAGAEKFLQKKVAKAVITVPAYFNETQRNATIDSAKLANLEVARLINEPTSASLAYGLDEKIEGIYVVYDLGGGTFDVSILKMQRGIFKVLSTAGDTHLGGDDIDNMIYENILSFLKQADNIDANVDAIDNNQKNYLIKIAKTIKEELSYCNNVEKTIQWNNKSLNFSLDVHTLNTIIQPLLHKTLSICKNAIVDAKIAMDEIKGVILVGGATKIPLLQITIQNYFNMIPLCSINPDEVVSIGAGHQGGNLAGITNNALLLDVLPLSLGIEMGDGTVEKLIPRNSTLPIAKAQEFTTSVDNQSSILIHILQGERELAVDLVSLGKFSLSNIPSLPAGLPRIKVSFFVDSDGLLKVEAQESISGVKQSIEIKPTWGMSFTQMREMIEDSMENSQRDILLRLLLQSIGEAKAVIYATKKALKEDSALLQQDEIKNIEEAVEHLHLSINNAIAKQDNSDNIEHFSEYKKDVEAKMELLEVLTNSFAQKRMNSKIKSILQGQQVDELDKKI